MAWQTGRKAVNSAILNYLSKKQTSILTNIDRNMKQNAENM